MLHYSLLNIHYKKALYGSPRRGVKKVGQKLLLKHTAPWG
jgi:hypothetical protein